MERPRLLLVPNLSEIEWRIRPLLEQWADVASYDAPGVGEEPRDDDGFSSSAIGRRGIAEIERRGWEGCVVVADEFGVAAAVHIVGEAPAAVQAMALGHARLSNMFVGERAPINKEIHAGCASLIRNDPRSFVRQLFRMTGGERMEGGYGDDMVEEYRRRVPVDLMLPFWESRPHEGTHIGERLLELDIPLLLAQHKGCLLFTEEGFRDAAAALPDARSVAVEDKPSTSPEFARVLEAFCREQLTVSA